MKNKGFFLKVYKKYVYLYLLLFDFVSRCMNIVGCLIFYLKNIEGNN